MRAETRGRLWSAMLWTALAAALAGIVATAGAFDASILLPVMDAGGTPIRAVAWYKLDGNATDSSGNGYHGTVVGATPSEGVYGGGYSLSTGTYIEASPISGLSVSCFAWVYASSTVVESYRAIISTAQLGGVPRVSYGFSNSNRIRISTPLASVMPILNLYSPDNTISFDKWHHIGWTYNGAAMNMYVDGVLVAVAEGGGAILGFNSRIGMSSLDRQSLVGNVDDVRIYDRALSPANIQRIMTGQDVEPIEELQ